MLSYVSLAIIVPNFPTNYLANDFIPEKELIKAKALGFAVLIRLRAIPVPIDLPTTIIFSSLNPIFLTKY